MHPLDAENWMISGFPYQFAWDNSDNNYFCPSPGYKSQEVGEVPV
jgi:hypothetical protein